MFTELREPQLSIFLRQFSIPSNFQEHFFTDTTPSNDLSQNFFVEFFSKSIILKLTIENMKQLLERQMYPAEQLQYISENMEEGIFRIIL
jgi:hypothetical protein